jgi:hypothetical protein
MAIERFDSGDAEGMARMRGMFGPQQVDSQIRQAIQFCWMALPPEKQSVEEVERQIRRIVERALGNLREDSASFGLGGREMIWEGESGDWNRQPLVFSRQMSDNERFDRPVGASHTLFFWLGSRGSRWSPLAIYVCPFGAKYRDFFCAKSKNLRVGECSRDWEGALEE